MQSNFDGEKIMNQPLPRPVAQLRPGFPRRSALMSWNLQLLAEVEALTEDNKQLRAALSIYSEVARRAPASVETACEQVA